MQDTVARNMKKDFFGIELVIGDYVVFNYAGFTVGKVIRFTPKMMEVEWGHGYLRTSKKLIYASESMRLEGEQVVVYKLKNAT